MSQESAISIIRLVGSKRGYLTVEACLASGNVNVCLIPEIKWSFYGPNGLLAYATTFLSNNHNLILAVAEGSGKSLIDD